MMQNLYTTLFRNRLLKASAYLFFACLISSCKKEKSDLPDERLQYFDISVFIKEEAERLVKQKAEVSKTVFLNGKEEKKILPVESWESELSAFLDADINKKSFRGKYKVEPRNEDSGSVTQYSAQEENLRTRKLSVTFANDGTPVKIDAVLYTSNVLYSSHQQLTYERDKGYWISGKQAIRFLEPDTFAVAATIFHP